MYIAGAGDPRMIKCLHAHMAYFLVNDDYLVGREIEAAIVDIWCPDETERCAGWMKRIRKDSGSSEGI